MYQVSLVRHPLLHTTMRRKHVTHHMQTTTYKKQCGDATIVSELQNAVDCIMMADPQNTND